MNASHMAPYGIALRDFIRGDLDAQIVVRRDDGFAANLAASHFFRSPDQFSEIEIAALSRCSGRVLDIGAGSGIHTLYLQEKNIEVTALDLCPYAVEIMKNRGIKNVMLDSIFDMKSKSFDTLLLLGHGIGMVETIHGLKHFLTVAQQFLKTNGTLLLDSVDASKTKIRQHLDYHELNRQADRYIGETRIRFEYKQDIGPYFGWLHIDFETLTEYAKNTSWRIEKLLETEFGEYLAALNPY